MIYGLYAVKDELEGFNAPFILKSDELALRNYILTAKDSIFKNDLSLYKIGTFEDQSGTIIGIEPECLMKGVKEDGENEI